MFSETIYVFVLMYQILSSIIILMSFRQGKGVGTPETKPLKGPPRLRVRGITSKTNGDFYYLNCLHFLRTKTKLE